MINNITVFTDFDGTITTKDIGDDIFLQFGQFEPYHTKLLAGDITISDYWKKLINSISNIHIDKLNEYILDCEIDPYFISFADFCDEHNIKLITVSDGFDFYINKILSNAGLERIPVACNKLIVENNFPVSPHFPLATESCQCLCASCKRNSVLRNTEPDTITVFIGDGYSDYCAARHADYIFAKSNLAAYCNHEKIPHFPFKNFSDIIRIFKSILLKKKLKPRNQARLLIKKAYEIE